MKSLRQRLVLAVCMTAVAMDASAQDAATAPSVVLLQFRAPEASYPPLAQSARVTGTVNARVGVRPDGSVAEVTFFPQSDLA
jgi:outer membrane biosynthesis protein TonB